MGVPLPDGKKEEQIEHLVRTGRLEFRDLLAQLQRDELKAACRAHQLDDSGRARADLQARLLLARGETVASAPPPPLFTRGKPPGYAPQPGDIVACRHRQWLVEDVVPPPAPKHATRVRMVCLDDDDQGRVLETFWELELGARVLPSETGELPPPAKIDQPRHFAAYLHALKWNAVTATDARLFQAPFRAGIRLMQHQLTPLTKALSLPRANLFIADDVGLGKTIEAGLVLQELLLRQRVEFVLVICPASVQLQWKEEMAQRFGLQFEIMSRHFVGKRRKERGFGVNPWSTHRRFIVSHALIRRPEYRDPLLSHLQTLGADAGGRAKKSLLVLDEAHVAAPASASKWAVDSEITRVIRDVAPRFENRLFLSATPHNGHSSSFSALLEILDPQRFTRAVPIEDPERLRPVMVRRLKEDLRGQEGVDFPKRILVQVQLGADRAQRPSNAKGPSLWSATDIVYDRSNEMRVTRPSRPIGEHEPVELELGRMLAEYTRLMKPAQGRGKLVFVHLQKRLLSSVPAFYRTLKVHAERVRAGTAEVRAQLPLRVLDDTELGVDDETLDQTDEEAVADATLALRPPEERARELLERMLQLAERHRRTPDAKVLALLDWIRTHQCKAVAPGGASDHASPAERAWTSTRVIVFTEYGDTRKYLVELLQAAFRGTDRADERILQLYGGMSEEQRAEVQSAFNAPPDQSPVRVLVATDAAREGINLQAHCADLFHFDVPWNPGRLEQRNGRIDRTLQPSPEVRCHYFRYADRAEDLVLERLVEKVEVIQRELGSLGAVIMDRIDAVLSEGITEETSAALEHATEVEGRERVEAELEAQRKSKAELAEEIREAGEILAKSAKVMDFRRELLRDAIDVGLELAGAPPLIDEGHDVFRLPELPPSWAETLDHLRPPRSSKEEWWEWRKKKPRPVVFTPPKTMTHEVVHLHLSHPFVQRVLGRFLAQGYSAHDLSRVTIVKNPRDPLVRVIAFGRLSLYGPGAARLHDRLLSVSARWIEGREHEIRPFAEEADRNALLMLEDILAGSPSL
ncbi:MAG TPA: DISARM system SNF2-like helicase DrmD, partial [Sandaracinaceae bacterium]